MNSKSFTFTIIFVFLNLGLFAHGGRTDSRGGHNDRKNGGYHYHHGRPAHSHYEGHCPYDADGDLLKLSLIGSIASFLYFKTRDKKRA